MRNVQIVAAAVLLVGCGEGLGGGGLGGGGDDGPADPGPSSGEPWREQFLMGNTSVNSANIVTNQDGVSLTIIDDYVLESALPTSELEFFSLHVYFPVDDSVVTEVSSANAQVTATDGRSSGDIFLQGDSLQRTQLGDTLYSTFRLTARDTTLYLTRSEFANVGFTFDVAYQDDSGAVLNTTRRTAGFYKR